MDRLQARVLLACAALGLIVLTVMVANLARLGGAITREVYRAQADYLYQVGGGHAAERNALLLGQCLRREMLKSARAGFVHADTWSVAARSTALPRCSDGVLSRDLQAAALRSAPVVATTAVASPAAALVSTSIPVAPPKDR